MLLSFSRSPLPAPQRNGMNRTEKKNAKVKLSRSQILKEFQLTYGWPLNQIVRGLRATASLGTIPTTTKLKTHLLFIPDILSSLYSFPFSLPPFLFSTGVLPLPPHWFYWQYTNHWCHHHGSEREVVVVLGVWGRTDGGVMWLCSKVPVVLGVWGRREGGRDVVVVLGGQGEGKVGSWCFSLVGQTGRGTQK